MGEIKYVLSLGIILVAWCTDASGESAKMRRLLRQKIPWIVVVDCWAHQVRLSSVSFDRTIYVRQLDESYRW